MTNSFFARTTRRLAASITALSLIGTAVLPVAVWAQAAKPGPAAPAAPATPAALPQRRLRRQHRRQPFLRRPPR
jgi:hypothetical protein